jgi:hypothetical protein
MAKAIPMSPYTDPIATPLSTNWSTWYFLAPHCAANHKRTRREASVAAPPNQRYGV